MNKKMKTIKERVFNIVGKPLLISDITKFRQYWLKKGYELVDITQLCEFKLSNSGWCNSFNEPDDNIYHIQCWYRKEPIINFPGGIPIDDEKYVVFITNLDDYTGPDFIIFRKVPIK